MARYGKSPYIYPLYGLGELPQSFARLSAIYGGTYMLDKPVHEIVTDQNGNFVGVRSGDETVKAKQVIGDPSYFGAGQEAEGGKLRVVEDGKVVRAICILKHPIPGTDDSDSVQIIIPQNQVNRRNGMCCLIRPCITWLRLLQISISLWFLQRTTSVLRMYTLRSLVPLSRRIIRRRKSSPDSSFLDLSMRSKWNIIFGTGCSADHVNRFVSVSPLYTPVSSGEDDNIFITRSYDATSHFETVVEEVQDVWKRVMGKDLVLKKREVEAEK